MEIGIQYTQDIKDGVSFLEIYLQSLKKIAIDVVFVDGSIVPLHRHGGGSLKKTRYSGRGQKGLERVSHKTQI